MQWISDETLQAVCRTFLHSLWQGMIAAVLAGLVLMLTRRTAARTRYNLLGFILLLSLVAAGFTFYLEAGVPQRTPAASGSHYITAAAPSAIPPVTHPGDILLNYMNDHAGLIMLVWLIVFMFRCCRLMGGYYHIRRIRQGAVPADLQWAEQVQRLSGQLGLSKPVQLFETAMAQVPFTLGFLKPCIFVPLGMLAKLPADQVETILLHELAHIRRKDYLVNMLQHAADTIFFFNPALRWISALLREEREACCDDIVMANTRQQSSYLHALIAFQERSAEASLGMALMGKQQHLLNRVKRLLTRENKKLSIMERSILMLGILAFTAFSFMPVQEQQITPEAPVPQDAMCDTIPPKKQTRTQVVLQTDSLFVQKKPAAGNPVCVTKTIVLNNGTPDISVQVDTVFDINVNANTDVNTNTDVSFSRNISVNTNANASADVRIDTAPGRNVRVIRLDTVNKKEVKTIYIHTDTVVSHAHKVYKVSSPASRVVAFNYTPKKVSPKPRIVYSRDSFAVRYKTDPVNRKIKVYAPDSAHIYEPQVIKTPKPVPAPKPYKPAKGPAAAAPVKSGKTISSPKKPSNINEKYTPVLPGALLKTMNIGKPQEEC
ncbi:M56 family metallopeptidase [Chitinophaga sp. XS-30]|uniref:M56 family metallopeptidase n=1 Tax=Chitinophaga sp. XS-30 TaxID=2604421 RepID=UPI0011DD69D8|nr:M56 family metallopeptidase [Chitinophaga sp. XS-30]QEH43574.1 M56 family metallopeptidase [Chitinophaga sp. XS-30]